MQKIHTFSLLFSLFLLTPHVAHAADTREESEESPVYRHETEESISYFNSSTVATYSKDEPTDDQYFTTIIDRASGDVITPPSTDHRAMYNDLKFLYEQQQKEQEDTVTHEEDKRSGDITYERICADGTTIRATRNTLTSRFGHTSTYYSAVTISADCSRVLYAAGEEKKHAFDELHYLHQKQNEEDQ